MRTIILVLAVSFSTTVLSGAQILFHDDSPQVGPKSPDSPRCVPLSECPFLENQLAQKRSGINNFEECGFDDSEPLYLCPDDEQDDSGEEECVCEKLRDYEAFKYCCPQKSSPPNSSAPDPRGNAFGNRQAVLPNEEGVRRSDDDLAAGISNENSLNTMNNAEEERPSECGVQPGFRIRGGRDSVDHEWPWAAALVYINPETDTRLYLCGGTLIDRRHVLTAAHCISSSRGHGLAKVRLGHANLTSSEAFDVDIELVLIHDHYKTEPLLINDLALLRLKENVTISEKVRHVCLPEPVESDEELFENEEAIVEPEVIGWGLVNETSTAEVLQKLRVSITSKDECEQKYQEKVPFFHLRNSQICASGELGTDSCKGDSGGPLLYLTPSSQYELVGVTSFGTVRCDSSVPGVYTRVQSHLKWINENMARDIF